tara:strand:- start:392 stop:601 length:210 start_codon:yes stop_codon:yes gene_type:complete
MENKGFEAKISLDETPPNYEEAVEKPLKVDINVLKARAQDAQEKQNRKNIIIFICFLLIIGTIGVYLSI